MVQLRDQSLPFLFEAFDENGALVDRYILPINPEEYRLRHRPKHTVTQTKGGAWEDSFGNGLANLSVRGTFGYLGSLPGGGARTVSGIQLCGQDLFLELERIFLEFHARFGALASNNIGKPTLHFFNFADEHYYAVQIQTFDLSRSIQRRHLYQYALQMVGLYRLDAPAGERQEAYLPVDELQVSLFDDVPEPPVEETSFWLKALEGYQWVSSRITGTINTLQGLQQDLTTIQQAVRSFRQDISDLIEAPFELVEAAFAAVDTILDTVESLADIPREFVVHLRETKRTLCRYRIARALFREPPDPGTLLPAGALNRSATEILTAGLPRGEIAHDLDVVPMRNPETTLFAPEARSEPAAVGEVIAASNDTLQTIAHRYLGDPAAWTRLALLNDLTAPYELVAGQRIRIPASTTGRVAVLDPQAPSTAADWAGKAYGADEMLDDRGDHAASGTGDCETVAGLDNLAMQLRHRLNTVRGELTEVGHPRFGCLLPTFIGKIASDYWMERAKVEAKIAILEDPRVASVHNLSFTEQNGAIWIEGDVRPINRASSERLRLLVG